MLKFQLADRLGVTLSTIDDMPADEFFGWVAYLQIITEDSDP